MFHCKTVCLEVQELEQVVHVEWGLSQLSSEISSFSFYLLLCCGLLYAASFLTSFCLIPSKLSVCSSARLCVLSRSMELSLG